MQTISLSLVSWPIINSPILIVQSRAFYIFPTYNLQISSVHSNAIHCCEVCQVWSQEKVRLQRRVQFFFGSFIDMASYVGGYSPAKPWNPCNLATSDIHFKNDYDYDYVETWWISLEFIWQRPPQPLQPLQPCNFRGVDDIAQRTPQPPQPCNLWETPIITLRNLATSETL